MSLGFSCRSAGAAFLFMSLRWRCATGLRQAAIFAVKPTQALSLSAAFLRKASRLGNDLG